MVRLSLRLAVPSCPVEIHVRPQHSGSVGIVDLPARVLQQRDRGPADVGWK